MRASTGPSLAAILLCACTGGSEPLNEAKATAGCTSAEFPASGRSDVCEVYERIEAAIAANSTIILPTLKLDSFLGADQVGEAEDLELRLVHSKVLAPDAFYEINGLPQPGVQPQFSSLSRTVIRGWAEEYLKPWE